MKKMKTLFERKFTAGGRLIRITKAVTDGCEWVLAGEGSASEKVDGSCCAIIGGRFYRRFDAKRGRTAPEGAIPCQEAPDPVTGHFPHWVLVDPSNPADKWYWNAYINTPWASEDGTYEAVGVHFQNNPYGLDDDFLERHGRIRIADCPRTFDGIRRYLESHNIEGIVFRREDGEMCKIKRSDFGLIWRGMNDE